MNLKLNLVYLGFPIALLAVPFRSDGALNCQRDTANAYPAVVKIVRSGPEYEGHCTGTIIGGGYILTAAHCLYHMTKHSQELASARQFKVLAGPASEIDLGAVAEVIPFPGYVAFGHNDVGLLQMARLSLPAMAPSVAPLAVGDRVIVGGYGAIRYASVKGQAWRRMGKNEVKEITDRTISIRGGMIAADGKTVLDCPYCIPIGQDSGSPLIHDGKVRGLFYTGEDEWLRDGRTNIRKVTYLSLAEPGVREFLRAHLGDRWCEHELR